MAKETKRPSLHQLALALEIPYARLANAQVAYKPQMGKPYSKDEINWEAVDAFATRRLERTEFATLDELYGAAIELVHVAKKRTRDPNSVWGQFLFGTTPVRKGNLKVGDKIHYKKTDIDGIVVFVNDTIVCYDPISEDGSPVTTQSVGNRVFNNQFEIIEPTE